jgi:hypothetical protein
MELECLRLVCTNGQEYIITNEENRSFKDVFNFLEKGLFGNNYFALQSKDHDPIYIRLDKIFSVQKVNRSIVGAQTRTWRLVE